MLWLLRAGIALLALANFDVRFSDWIWRPRNLLVFREELCVASMIQFLKIGFS